MRILVVDHVGNPGGGSRVVRALLPALRRVRSDVEIEYLGNAASIEREGLAGELRGAGIKTEALQALRYQSRDPLGFPGGSAVLRRFRRGLPRMAARLPLAVSGNVTREVEVTAPGFDLIYFPWPYLLEPPEVDVPLVGTFHDFNFKYFFGGVTYHAEDQLTLDGQMQRWLDRAWPVVSTQFMSEELVRFYPRHRHSPTVVRLAAPSHATSVERIQAERRVAALGVPSKYLLYPCNPASHKNISTAIAAVAELREQGHAIPLVLTGPTLGSHVSGRATAIGVERGASPADVIGLGYVSNEEIDALITCATAVLSCSLYEAGNGPGLDAWSRGIPVAMSNIPPFMEHMTVQGVTARVFDPRKPADLAAQIQWILEHPELAAAQARSSELALQEHTWERTALGYCEVFNQALGAAANERK